MAARPDPRPIGPACRQCGEPRGLYGKRWRCRPCDREARKKWLATRPDYNKEACAKYGSTRREQEAARVREWTAANREQVVAAQRARYYADVEASRESRRRQYAANPEPYLERARLSTWRQDNPEAARAVIARRRARKRDAICPHGPGCVSGDFMRILYSRPCLYCGAAAEHADHFEPLARGGLHCVDNLVPACGPCNLSKSHRDPYEWLDSLTG